MKSQKERNHSTDLEVDGRIQNGLKEIGQKGVGWIQQAQDWEPVVESCEHGDEISGTTKDEETADKLNDCQLLHEVS
jgi:hypothetical protein